MASASARLRIAQTGSSPSGDARAALAADHPGMHAPRIRVLLLEDDPSAAADLAASLAHAALHDQLTGLPNRALLADRLGQAFARLPRSGGKLAVLLLGIDGLTLVGDAPRRRC